jgi:L-amino acid N-acyltransferase YncA
MKSIPPPNALYPLCIRIAKIDDLPGIVEIFNQAVSSHRSSATTTPVTVESRKAWFVEHDPNQHPIYVAEYKGILVGWCSVSMYRPGRNALRFTAELSCYVNQEHQGKGAGSSLIRHAMDECSRLGIKNLVGVVIDRNIASQKMLERLGFQKWGYLPQVLDFDGEEYGEYYYGKRVSE